MALVLRLEVLHTALDSPLNSTDLVLNVRRRAYAHHTDMHTKQTERNEIGAQ